MGMAPLNVGPCDPLAGLCNLHRTDRVCRSPREQRHPVAPPVAARLSDEAPAPAPVTYHRKSYAPDPIGKVTPRARVAPPAPGPAPIESFPWVTNLGTLIDVLA